MTDFAAIHPPRPRSLRRRLVDAAATNDLVQLAWLRQLDMADENDYLTALPTAIEHGCIKAAEYLCESIQILTPTYDNYDLYLLRNAITSALNDVCVAFGLQIAQCFPGELLKQLRQHPITSTSTITNLLHIVRADSVKPIFTPFERQALLHSTFIVALTSSSNTSPVYEHVAELVRVHGAQASMTHAHQICASLECKRDCPELTRILYDFVLSTLSAINHSDLLAACFKQYTTGRALRVLLMHSSMMDKYDAYCSTLATLDTQCTAWGSVEVCLDMLPWNSEDAASFLKQQTLISRVYHDESVIVGRVLVRLLPRVPDDALPPPCGSFDTFKYLIECHLQRNMRIPSYLSLANIGYDSLQWLWQRNPSLRDLILAGVSVHTRQALSRHEICQIELHTVVLACTSLAQVLVNLVCQYT
jgi:hypothetical protein